jgi:hypothetical protein
MMNELRMTPCIVDGPGGGDYHVIDRLSSLLAVHGIAKRHALIVFDARALLERMRIDADGTNVRPLTVKHMIGRLISAIDEDLTEPGYKFGKLHTGSPDIYGFYKTLETSDDGA